MDLHDQRERLETIRYLMDRIGERQRELDALKTAVWDWLEYPSQETRDALLALIRE